MHLALEITEIVELIVAQLDSNAPGSPETARSLAALACTSTLLSSAALDALWREQTNILNLILCMPEDLWESRHVDGTLTLVPRRAFIASDWDRVAKYAYRIKSLICLDAPMDGSKPALIAVYTVLQTAVPGNSLLPKLHHLSWYHMDTAYSSFIDLFLGPLIESIHGCPALTIVSGRHLNPISVVIDAVIITSPDPDRELLSSFVRSLTRVESLDVRTMDSQMLRHLGQLNTLKSLAATFPPSLSLRGFPERSMFPALRSAIVQVDNAEDISPLIALIHTWNNASISVFEAYLVTPVLEEAGKLYEALSSHCSHEHLETLRVFITPRLNAVVNTHPRQFFQPLLNFTHLRVVEIEAPIGYDLDDATVSDMAQAWTNIEQLELRSRRHHYPQSTLLSLDYFARYCPRLWKLRISLDASSVPQLPTPRVAQETFTSFTVQTSPISDAVSVATFISSLFPNLRQIKARMFAQDRMLAGGRHQRWKEVEKLLQR
ncbi:hypothetical protein B0H19DRAFT_1193296 [Mycena capillaripes]|nr:hypothetical protein B0H19DRAFT_1193296 [Mycena capillaripes]